MLHQRTIHPASAVIKQQATCHEDLPAQHSGPLPPLLPHQEVRSSIKADASGPLCTAVFANDTERVVSLLQQNIDVNARFGSLRVAAIHVAALTGSADIAALLLQWGADVSLSTSSGSTAMHIAAANGSDTVIAVLAACGADVNAADQSGWTPLHVAAAESRVGTLSLLHYLNADVGAAAAGSGLTALHVAAATSSESTATLLLQHGADVGAVDAAGLTALHSATFADRISMARHLLDFGAELEAVDGLGWTALFAATAQGSCSMARMLLDRGANANARAANASKWPVLHAAAAVGDPSLVTLLLEHGADISVKDSQGRTALHAVIMGASSSSGCGRAQAEATLELLLDRGASATAADASGCTALNMAIPIGSQAMVELLLKSARGLGSADAACFLNVTPLRLAVSSGNHSILALLLEHGSFAPSALAEAVHVAAGHERWQMCAVLLRALGDSAMSAAEATVQQHPVQLVGSVLHQWVHTDKQHGQQLLQLRSQVDEERVQLSAERVAVQHLIVQAARMMMAGHQQQRQRDGSRSPDAAVCSQLVPTFDQRRAFSDCCLV